MTAPVSHLQEAHKLTADALVNLFEIQLKRTDAPVFVRFTDGPEVMWQGKTWEALPCQLTGVARNADDERARPKLRIVNPLSLFNTFARKGHFDGAIIERRRVLKAHIDSNTNIYDAQLWYIGRVLEIISGQSITFELRALVDGPDQLVPARKFIPPEFPFVTL